MLSKASYTKSKNLPNGQDKNIVAVRSGNFYGLKYEKIKKETSSFKRGIVVSPNFIFYTNNTKVLIDFSDYKNTVDSKIIEDFFSLVPTGTSFTVTEGNWVNTQLTEYKISLSGSYTFEKYVNNILFATVVSTNNIDSNIVRYDKQFFENTPNFNLTLSTTDKTSVMTNIVNLMGKNSKNSFTYLGVRPGDILNITNQRNRFVVHEISFDDDGKEIVTVLGEIPEEDRTSSLTVIAVIVENKDNTDITKFSSEKIGSCNVIKNGIPTCLNNQSELQCQLRKNSKFKETVGFSEGTYCPEIDLDALQNSSPSERLTTILDQNSQIMRELKIESNNFRRR